MPTHAVVSPSDTHLDVGDITEGTARGEDKKETVSRWRPRTSCACQRPLLAPVASQEEDLDEDAVWNAVWEPEVHGTPEARATNSLPEPRLPNPSGVAEHNRTHNPYRSWCPVCVAAAGREDAHHAGARDEEGEQKVPTIGFDYCTTSSVTPGREWTKRPSRREPTW